MPDEASHGTTWPDIPRIDWKTLFMEGLNHRSNGDSFAVLRVLFAVRPTDDWLVEFNALAAQRFLNEDSVLYSGADVEGITFGYIVDGDAEWCRAQFDALLGPAETERLRGG